MATTTLTRTQQRSLAAILQSRRAALGISASEAARRSGVDTHTYLDLEKAVQPRPTMPSLQAIAGGLEIPIADILAATEWLPKGELPSFRPYLRTKYHDMPDSALQEIERYFQKIAAKHHIADGPQDGEDEN